MNFTKNYVCYVFYLVCSNSYKKALSCEQHIFLVISNTTVMEFSLWEERKRYQMYVLYDSKNWLKIIVNSLLVGLEVWLKNDFYFETCIQHYMRLKKKKQLWNRKLNDKTSTVTFWFHRYARFYFQFIDIWKHNF